MLLSWLQRLSDSHFRHDHVYFLSYTVHSRNCLRHREVVVRQESLVPDAVEGAADASDAGLGRCEEEEATGVPVDLFSQVSV